MRRIDLQPEHLALVLEILKKHVPGRNVRAFGSRVNGKAKKNSDLDLAVMGDSPLPSKTLSALREEFDESDLPFQVDLVAWASISLSFRAVIEKDEVTVWEGGEAS
ncbi:MAG: nucleotidyltransferase domain-containing protein [Elusimicrobia bacterium]|nr:nucleotidyltransferase domain-containing protein [Elusimicrobiota bacterium]